MSFTIPRTPFGDHVRERLENELVAWMTTVSPDGMPRPSPIWFLLEGDTMLIYSKDGTSRTHNLARDPSCAINFNSTDDGGDIVILEGTAVVSEDPPSPEIPAYQVKYLDEIPAIGMDPGSFAIAYPVPIRFTPERLRGH